MARVEMNARRHGTGDFVLFRDVDAFYAGAAPAECTYVCRVTAVGPCTYTLQDTRSDRRWTGVQGEYMRALDPAEVMRDIDTAPLDTAGGTGLESAATAWLRQQAGGR